MGDRARRVRKIPSILYIAHRSVVVRYQHEIRYKSVLSTAFQLNSTEPHVIQALRSLPFILSDLTPGDSRRQLQSMLGLRPNLSFPGSNKIPRNASHLSWREQVSLPYP